MVDVERHHKMSLLQDQKGDDEDDEDEDGEKKEKDTSHRLSLMLFCFSVLHNNGHCEIMRKLSESLFLYVCSFLVLKSFVNCLWPGVCIKPADLFTCVCMMMDAHLLLIDFVSPDNAATGQEGRRR
jgi:hypothetical protein